MWLNAHTLVHQMIQVVDNPHVPAVMDNLGGDVSEKRVLIGRPWDVNLQIVNQGFVLARHINVQFARLPPVALIANTVVGRKERETEGVCFLADHDESVALDGKLATI
jgi:hypothetical protein